jgi:hypothetical protein
MRTARNGRPFVDLTDRGNRSGKRSSPNDVIEARQC